MVQEGGIDALTIRDVARRAGCSTSVVSHYFANKLEMFLFTHRMARARAEARLMGHLEAGDDLVTCLRSVLPIDEDGKRDWHTWISFWGMAPAEPVVHAEWLEGTAGARDVFAALLQAARDRGEIAASTDPVRDAGKIHIIINGIGSMVLQDAATWTAARQLEALHEFLALCFQFQPQPEPQSRME